MVPVSWNGSQIIYTRLVRPFFLKHERVFDNVVSDLSGKAKSAAEAVAKEGKVFPVSSPPPASVFQCLCLMRNTWMFHLILLWCKLNNMWKLAAVPSLTPVSFFPTGFTMLNAEKNKWFEGGNRRITFIRSPLFTFASLFWSGILFKSLKSLNY